MVQIKPGRWRGRNVLVTGVGGFIGSGLAEELVRLDANVVGILRDSPGSRVLQHRGIADAIDIVRGSITEPGLAERAINEYSIDTVFHLAAQAIVTVANSNPVSTFESNIAGTWQVLEGARRSPSVTRVVCASSDKAYGNQAVLPYTEDTPLAGVYPYDASKVCTDVLARSYATSFGLPVAVVRAANIYGPGDMNWNRLVPGTVRSVLQGEAPLIRSDGTLERDYLYLGDVVAGYLAVAEHLPDVSGEAFNLGTECPVSVLSLVGRIVALAGDARIEPQVLGVATNEIDRQSLASGKAAECLGWRPEVDLDEGITRTIEWYRRHLSTVVDLREEVHA
jgi:CDP-glucose 4,6-dehydratase